MVELLRLLTRPADTVVISPPVYPPFFDWAPEAGTRLLEVPLTGEFRLDLPALEAAFAAHPAVYVLCNPHNPVGRVHTREELTALVRLARLYGVTVVSDEIHAPLVLPGAEFTPLLSIPGAGEVAVSLLSASKAFNLAGLKCAAIVTGGPALAALVGRLPPDVRWRTGHLGVLATVAAFKEGDAWLAELHAELDERRAQLGRLLSTRLPGVRWRAPEATYLAWLDCRALGRDDEPQELFLAKGRVAVEPGTRFGAADAELRPAELRDELWHSRRGDRADGGRHRVVDGGRTRRQYGCTVRIVLRSGVCTCRPDPVPTRICSRCCEPSGCGSPRRRRPRPAPRTRW
nr:hypothetical protein GCM10020092_083280 [Actinoplanes digitatis]